MRSTNSPNIELFSEEFEDTQGGRGRVKNQTTKEIVSIFGLFNFSYICSNSPAAPEYGAYISQLIRYYRA
jgi:hypothetical protein